MAVRTPRDYWVAELWVLIPQNGFIDLESARVWTDCESAREEATKRNNCYRRPKRPWTVITLARAMADLERYAMGEFESVA